MPNDVDITVGADSSAVSMGLAAARNAVRSTLDEISSMMAAPITFGAIVEATKSVIEYGAKIYDMGQRFGVSTTSLQQFGNAAERTGSSLESMAMGFSRLEVARSKALGGNDALVQAFGRLNVSVEDLQNLTPDQLMLKLGSSTMNAADTVKILGRNGTELRPVLQGLANDTIKLGSAMDTAAIKNAKELDDQLKQLGQDAKVTFGPAGIGLAGAALRAVQGLGIGLVAPFSIATQGWDATVKKLQQYYADRDKAKASIATGAPGGLAGGGDSNDFGDSSANQQESLQARLDRLQEEHLAKQRSNEEELDALQEKRLSLYNDLYEASENQAKGTGEENGLLKAQIALGENQVQIDNVSATIDKEKAAAQEKYTQEREKALDAADDEAKAAGRRLQILQLEISGHGDLVDKLKEGWEFQDKISDLTDQINEAWSEADQTLAEQLTKMRDQVTQEEKLTGELDKQKDIQRQIDDAKNKREQQAGKFNEERSGISQEQQQQLARGLPGQAPKSQEEIAALGGQGTGIATLGSAVTYSDPALLMATDPSTGVVNQDQLTRNRALAERALLLGQPLPWSTVQIMARQKALQALADKQTTLNNEAQRAANLDEANQLSLIASGRAGVVSPDAAMRFPGVAGLITSTPNLFVGGAPAKTDYTPALGEILSLLQSIDQRLRPNPGAH